MNHFISDTHIGHHNILDYDDRPFPDIETHDNSIIENVNDTLKGGDDLYHLGDVAWKESSFKKWVERLRSDITVHYIKGNHDERLKRSQYWPDVLMLKNTPVPFWLSHYPHMSWPNKFHGTIHLYGHVHGNIEGMPGSFEVSANVINYTPVSEMEIINKAQSNEKLRNPS